MIALNIYKSLNEITLYIEENLENKIDYNVLARFVGVNVYTLQRIFTLVVGVSLAEYIRKRRLSNAGFDIYNDEKIMDVAIKYQYDNATSFSRAFYKFHGIKPSMVNKETKLVNFPRIVFNENISTSDEVEYEIIELDEIKLYGIGTNVNNETISEIAPLFFRETESKYLKILGEVNYGMITYDMAREESQKYYCLYNKNYDGFDYINIPKSRWLKFHIDTQNAVDIQEKSHQFYKEFLPSCKYNLKELPELEYYHDGVCDFLVAIY